MRRPYGTEKGFLERANSKLQFIELEEIKGYGET